MLRPASLVFVLSGLMEFAVAQSLVRNIQGPGLDPNSNPTNAATFGGVTYFAAATRTSGTEPWRTDGTAAGTVLLADLNPGTGNSNPDQFTLAGNTVFFVATDSGGTDLWATDGTAAGTRKIVVRPGGGANPEYLTPHGGILYFSANDGSHGPELWRSDGTANGTWLVMDINPGAQGSQIIEIGSCHGSLYFNAFDGTGPGLWISDGSPPGTHLLLRIAPSHFQAIGACTVFTGDDGVTGLELWRTDGTPAGTQQVVDLAPGPTSGVQNSPLVMASGLGFFVGNGPNGPEVYRTDGTAAGTSPVSPGAAGSQPQSLMTDGSLVYYFESTANPYPHMLWRTDGTPMGTFRLQHAFYDWFDTTASVGNALFFAAAAAPLLSGTIDIWMTDGTVSGTRLVLPGYNLFLGSPGAYLFTSVLAANGTGVLCAHYDFAHGQELWRTDGTSAGTHLVADINAPVEDASAPAGFAATDKVLLFAATTTNEGRELWRTDGTPGGTTLVADLCPGPDPSNPQLLTRVGNQVYFVAQSSPFLGNSLWRTDGSRAGTSMVVDVGIGSTEGYTALTALGDRLLFAAFDFWHGRELWITDGTVDGTSLVRDINPGIADSAITAIVVIHGVGYFAATDYACGRELWRTDGTATGTSRVADLQTGNAPSNPDHLTAVGDTLFFTADDGLHGAELWRSDGTTAGTVMVLDIVAGVGASAPDQLTAMGEILYFTASDSRGRELWRSDGTAAGTYCVVDLTPGPQGSSITNLMAAGDRLYFTRPNGTATQLWVSDGTAAGTLPIDPTGSSSPANLTQVGAGRHILFSATTPGHGRELWLANGTAAGTVMLGEINPGAGDANPAGFARIGDSVVFAAEEPTLLRELYAVSLLGLHVPLADNFGSGCGGTGGVVPRLGVDQAGTLGHPLQLRITGAQPQSLAWFCFAAGRNSSPGGCRPMIDPFVADAAATTAAGEATWSGPIPNSPVFLGNELFSQGVALDPMGYLNLVSLTQGLRIVVGS